jgi:Carbamoyltransferase C-terminus
MVLTARAKADAHARIPAVIHADGSGRLQIVRANTDPLSYAYLKALGRRIGVEVAVNTSFNVAGPIAQTADQAVATLRRSKAMDAVLLFADEGPVFAACVKLRRARREGDSANGSRLGRPRQKARCRTDPLFAPPANQGLPSCFHRLARLAPNLVARRRFTSASRRPAVDRRSRRPSRLAREASIRFVVAFCLGCSAGIIFSD